MLQLFLTAAATLVFASHSSALMPNFPRQEKPAANGLRAELTLKEINERSENAKSVVDLDEGVQSSIQQLYTRARQQLEASLVAAAELNRFQEMSRRASDQLKLFQDELAKDPGPQPFVIEADTTESALEEMLRHYNVELAAARKNADVIAGEVARRQARQPKITDLLTESEKRIKEIESQLQAGVPPGESPVMTEARRTQLTAEKQNLEKQVESLKAEQTAYVTTADLPPLRDQIAQRKTKQLESDISAINASIAALRETEIQKIRRDAIKLKKYAVNNGGELTPIADENLELVDRLESVSNRIAKVNEKRQSIEKARASLNKEYEITKERVDAIGLNDTLGIMLRQNKFDVEKLRLKFRMDSSLRDEVSNIRAEAYRTEDQAKALADLDSAAVAHARELETNEQREQEIVGDTRVLLERRKETLDRLADLQLDSFNSLFGLLSEQRQFAKLCDEYTSYIDQRVLWIRSAKAVRPADFSTIMSASRQLASPAIWRSVGQSLLASMQNRLYMLLIIGSGLVILFAFQRRLRRNICETAKQTSRRTCRVFTPTATALLETILIATLWPTVVLTVGWLMQSDILAEPFTHALGGGLIAVGLAAAPFEFLRQFCRNDGLAEAHFDWPPPARRTIHANLRWLIVFGAPLLLVAVTLDHLGIEEWNNSLGRVCAILLLLVSTVIVFQILRPGGPLFLNHQNRESHFFRLRYFRFAVVVVGHIALIVFAIAGYYYTAYQLGTNLLQSLALAICLVTLYALSLRFLLVRRRRLRYEQLVQQREQQIKQQQQKEVESELDVSAVSAKLAESMDIELQSEVGTDISSVSRQARELTGVIFVVASLFFVWNIWQDAFPATKLLDNFELWPVAVGDKGETDIVSLGDLLISLGLFLLTYYSVRNIPGMLELLLLKRLPLDSGSRYAITTIFRYIILVAGIILALNCLKIPWSKYSWLVAAVSVGLGFGLQEIVANFVSGLIILLERPVRVGDVVTIDGTTGIVSRIQMRATTVTNWDNQELVVPNKDLITGKLMNWTLSSVVNRLAIKVGVAYGTDVDKVHRLITDVAIDNPHVLNDPAPLVTFEEFGDSSLNFTLRCCITAIEKRFVIVHEINRAINEVLDREGIVIPFPQRDVHMVQAPNSTGS